MTKEQIFELIESNTAKMQEILDFMETHPAAGYREWEACAMLEKEYRALGYELTMAGDIPGFYTDIETGKEGPKILVFSELDGLLVPGHPHADPVTNAAHACGHHAQCAALYGVAAALKVPQVLENCVGSIRLCVVPAEEIIELDFRDDLRKKGIIKYFGGKQEFLARGYFDGCDMAFMIHTGGKTHNFTMKTGCNGCVVKNVEFIGKATHAAAPRHGINALYAANLAMNAINTLRDTFNNYDFVRVHPILTEAGQAVNSIPGIAIMENQVRANNVDTITAINKKVNRAVAASAASIGAKAHLRDYPGYCPGAYDETLMGYMRESMAEVVGDENVRCMSDPWDTGCSDMGDISMVMPAVHAFGSGGAGAAHGVSYRIADFDSAVVDSAKAQVLILRNLLSNNAEKAKDVIAKASPRFASYEDYFNYVDSFYLDKDAVVYNEDGTVLLNI